MEKTLFLDAGNTRIKAAEPLPGRTAPTHGDRKGTVPSGKKQTGNPQEGDEGTAHAADISAVAQDPAHWRIHRLPEYVSPDFETALRKLCLPFDRIVMSSVRKNFQTEELKRLLAAGGEASHAGILAITRSVLTPGRHRYRTPETLGIDRFLACLGAWSFGPAAVIVSDAGTACTIDVMDAGGVYRGGVIMPGLHMLIEALGHGADGLFTVPVGLPETWPPDSTTTALQAGTAGTFVASWEAHVERTRERFPDARIWMTGGDADFLMHNSSFEVQSNNCLVFEGMRYWLDHLFPKEKKGG